MTAAATASELLASAEEICAGRLPVPGLSQARAAYLLTRQALEQTVDELLADRGMGCPRVNMRVRLICLAEAYPDVDGLAQRADAAWHRLSVACHHHAYELSPTVAEATSLICEVRWLGTRSTVSAGGRCRRDWWRDPGGGRSISSSGGENRG